MDSSTNDIEESVDGCTDERHATRHATRRCALLMASIID